MKKIISLLSALALLLSMMTTVAFADENNKIEWVKVDSTATTITLKLVATTNQQVASIAGAFSLDNAKENGVTAVNGAKIDAVTFKPNYSKSVIAFTFTNVEGATGEIELGTATFTVSDTTKSFTLPTFTGKTLTVKNTNKVPIADSFTATAFGQEIIVKEDVKDPTIALDPTSATLKLGETETVTIKATTENFDGTVEWKSDNEKVATVDKGVVTAVGAGEAIITATAGKATATCKITVEAADVPVESITLNKDDITLDLNGVATETLIATVLPADATDPTVTWKSDKPEIATVDGGKVTAVAVGEAKITATAGGKTATCKVTVVAPETKVDRETIGAEGAYDGKTLIKLGKIFKNALSNSVIAVKNETTGETKTSSKTIAEILGGETVGETTIDVEITVGVLTDTASDVFSFGLLN